jgi:hypothetical protein
MEKLEPLTIENKYTKPFPKEDRPYYSECEKRIIAWTIAWEGTLTINKKRICYETLLKVNNTDFELLTNFEQIIKIGNISDKNAQTEKSKPQKKLVTTQYRQILFILKELKGYMPCTKYRQLRSLIAEFCKSRIQANEEARLNKTRSRPCNAREHEIYRQVAKLNKRGR